MTPVPISADSHLEISTERWIDRVPIAHRDRAPRRISLPNGGDAWLVEGRPLRICGLELSGRGIEQNTISGVTYAGSPGTGSPQQRLSEQEQDGVDAEVLFPGVGGPNFWRGIANDDSYKAVIHAYNEFLIEEYCPVAPERLVGLGVIPETGITDALEELQYCADGGLKGVCLNGWPAGHPYPSDDDDAFWREALDRRIAITVHVIMRHMGGATRGPGLRYNRPPVDVATADPVKRIASWAQGGGLNAAQLVFAGTFERVPDLQIYFAENQLGWIPHFLEQLDMLYDRNINWAAREFGLKVLDRKPSEWIREHVHWGFSNNPHGVKIRHDIGVDKIMWSSDMPHSETDWPNSRGVVKELFDGVSADETEKIIRSNALAFFNLTL